MTLRPGDGEVPAASQPVNTEQHSSAPEEAQGRKALGKGSRLQDNKDSGERWLHLLTYGHRMDLYSCGRARRMVDRQSGNIVAQYTVGEDARRLSQTDVSLQQSDRGRLR